MSKLNRETTYGPPVGNRDWEINYAEIDCGFQCGLAVGMYRGGRPVLRHAVRSPTPDQQGFTSDQMAGALRALADWIDANKGRLT